jgi:hypothetical protein
MKQSNIKLSWLLEKDNFEDQQELLMNAIEKSGHSYKIVDTVLHFNCDENILKKYFMPNDIIIPYGSISFINAAKGDPRTKLGVFEDWKKFDCSSYYPYFYKYLLNNDFIMLPWGILKERIDEIYGSNEEMFFRPNTGVKSFSGKVVFKENFEYFADKEVACYQIPNDEIVLISKATNIHAEYRFIVVDDKVLTGSQYRHVGAFSPNPWYNEKAKNFLENILNEISYRPAFAFSADIAQIEEGYKLIELNAFNCCGLYGCNRQVIVNAINASVKNRYEGILK